MPSDMIEIILGRRYQHNHGTPLQMQFSRHAFARPPAASGNTKADVHVRRGMPNMSGRGDLTVSRNGCSAGEPDNLSVHIDDGIYAKWNDTPWRRMSDIQIEDNRKIRPFDNPGEQLPVFL